MAENRESEARRIQDAEENRRQAESRRKSEQDEIRRQSKSCRKREEEDRTRQEAESRRKESEKQQAEVPKIHARPKMSLESPVPARPQVPVIIPTRAALSPTAISMPVLPARPVVSPSAGIQQTSYAPMGNNNFVKATAPVIPGRPVLPTGRPKVNVIPKKATDSNSLD